MKKLLSITVLVLLAFVSSTGSASAQSRSWPHSSQTQRSRKHLPPPPPVQTEQDDEQDIDIDDTKSDDIDIDEPAQEFPVFQIGGAYFAADQQGLLYPIVNGQPYPQAMGRLVRQLDRSGRYFLAVDGYGRTAQAVRVQ